jgi:hypothetical protein
MTTPNDYLDVPCPMPDCGAALYLTWEMARPIFTSDLASPAPISPDGAYTGSWRVECVEGHVVLLPGDIPDCPDCSIEGHTAHDSDDELRTFQAADAKRLWATLQKLHGGAA